MAILPRVTASGPTTVCGTCFPSLRSPRFAMEDGALCNYISDLGPVMESSGQSIVIRVTDSPISTRLGD